MDENKNKNYAFKYKVTYHHRNAIMLSLYYCWVTNNSEYLYLLV